MLTVTIWMARLKFQMKMSVFLRAWTTHILHQRKTTITALFPGYYWVFSKKPNWLKVTSVLKVQAVQISSTNNSMQSSSILLNVMRILTLNWIELNSKLHFNIFIYFQRCFVREWRKTTKDSTKFGDSLTLSVQIFEQACLKPIIISLFHSLCLLLPWGSVFDLLHIFHYLEIYK